MSSRDRSYDRRDDRRDDRDRRDYDHRDRERDTERDSRPRDPRDDPRLRRDDFRVQDNFSRSSGREASPLLSPSTDIGLAYTSSRAIPDQAVTRDYGHGNITGEAYEYNHGADNGRPPPDRGFVSREQRPAIESPTLLMGDAIIPPPPEIGLNMLTSREVEHCRTVSAVAVKPTFSFFPPARDDVLKRVKPKPAGCKTIFVGNIPAVSDDSVIKELFSLIGNVEKVKMSISKHRDRVTKYCHVRFDKTQTTDRAVKYNGHYLVVAKPNMQFHMHQVGQITVDYACDNADLQDWERDQHHAEQIAEFVPRFSENCATRILQYVREPSRLVNSAKVITTWVNEGECKRMTSKTFFSLITTVNATVKKFPMVLSELREMVDKNKKEEESRKEAVVEQCNVLQGLYDAYKQHKAWEVFTKPQRKIIADYEQNLKKEIREITSFLDECGETRGKKQQVNAVQTPTTPVSSGSSSELDQMIIKTLKEENEKLKSSTAKRSNVAMENVSLQLQVNKSTAELEAVRKELARLNQLDVFQKSQLLAKDGEIHNRDNEIATLQASLQGLEQYVAHNPKERIQHINVMESLFPLNLVTSEDPIEEVEMEDASDETATETTTTTDSATAINDFSAETTDSADANVEQANAEESSVNDAETVTSEESVLKIKKEVSDSSLNIKQELGQKRTAENTSEGQAAKKLKPDMASLGKRDIMLLPLLSIYLHTCKKGATTHEIVTHLTTNGVNVSPELVQITLKKLPALFAVNTATGVDRWSLIVYDLL